MLPWWRSAPHDGDMEKSLRRFSIVMTFISIFFRIFVFLIFWKASVDYFTIIGKVKEKYGYKNQSDMFTEKDMIRDHHKEGYYRKTLT
jgi:hypothetical protein